MLLDVITINDENIAMTEIEPSLKVFAITAEGSKRKTWQKKLIKKIEINFAISIAYINSYNKEYRFPKTMSKVSLIKFMGIKSH